jgi:hypothetical protein
LNEDRRFLILVIFYCVVLGGTLAELVTEVPPIFLDEDSETLQGTVIGIDNELRKGTELGSPVPTIAAMDYHISS